jgi:hypothetical protein
MSFVKKFGTRSFGDSGLGPTGPTGPSGGGGGGGTGPTGPTGPSGGGGGDLTDLSYYFFDVPDVLYDGSGIVSTGSSIDLSWSLPPNTRAALPFGDTLRYPDGQQSEQSLPILFLPYFKELRIQYKDFTFNQDFTQGWTDLSINNTVPLQTHIPITTTNAYLSSIGTGASLENAVGGNTAPFTSYYDNGTVQTGRRYQFRVYLVNEGDEPGIVDPVYGGDVSYNYLYIPDASGASLQLGSFGFPTPPTQITFTSTSAFDDIDIFGVNNDPSGADTSLNIPFPINPQLNLQVRFGFDISGIPDPASIQMPNVKNTATLQGSYLSSYQLTNSITVDDSDLTTGNITWYPETKYWVRDFFMQNNAVDTSNVLAYVQNSAYLVPPPDPSYISIIPSRSQVGAQSQRLASGSLSYSDPGGITKANAYPISSGTIINDIYFLDPVDSFSLNMNDSFTFANNLDPAVTTGLRGTNSSGVNLTRFGLEVKSGATTINLALSSALRGFLDISSVSLSQNTLELSANSVEGSNLANPAKGHGYYTNASVNNIRITPISLTTYPDICNNSYLDYDFILTDFYRNAANTTFLTGNTRTTDFRTAKKPTSDVTYALNSYTNPNVTLDFNFFGQLLPSLSAVQYSVPYTYDLNNIDLWWRPALNISTSEILYAPGTGQETNAGKPIVTEPWNNAPSKTNINPQHYIEDDDVWVKGTNINQAQRYSRSITSSGGSQFGIETIVTNNITRTPAQTTYLEDVSFGTPGKYMWWDYTWEDSPSSTTASSTPTTGSGRLFPNSSYALLNTLGSGRNPAYSAYDHTLILPDIQLMWANKAFRSAGNSPASSDYPYIDFSANYYNPSLNKLRDYSGKASTGDSISLVCAAANPNQQWWNQPTFNGTINRTLKYLTFNITMPYTQNIGGGGGSAYGYTLSVNNGAIGHDTSTSGTPNGYWVYHTEDGASGYNPSSGTGFNGQWGVNAVSGGIGSWNTALDNNNGGYEVQDTTSGGTQTQVQISIGLPNNLAASISTISLTWVKA